jgi:hypothetical protein
MKRRILVVVCTAALALAAGCSWLGDLFVRPKLTRYYDSAQFLSCDCDCLEVSAFSMPVPQEPSPPPKTLLEKLGPEGQQAFIQEAVKPGHRIENVLKYLSPLAAEDSPKKIERTDFDRRVVFSVAKKEPNGCEREDCPFKRTGNFFLPADRISEIKLTLTLLVQGKEGKVPYITRWDRFVTRDEKVELGTLHRMQEFVGTGRLTASSPLGPSGATGEIETTAKSTTQLQEEVKLQKRRIILTGALSEDGRGAILRQEGAFETDLTGTFNVDFHIRMPHSDVKGIRVISCSDLIKNGKYADPKDVVITPTYYWLSHWEKPVKCELEYEYVIRKVIRCGRNINEGYHSVVYVRGSKKAKPFDFLRLRDYQVALFSIKEPGKNGRHLRLIEDFQRGWVLFADYMEAKEFLAWLKKKQSSTVGHNKLYLGNELQKNEITNLVIGIERFPRGKEGGDEKNDKKESKE